MKVNSKGEKYILYIYIIFLFTVIEIFFTFNFTRFLFNLNNYIKGNKQLLVNNKAPLNIINKFMILKF